MTTKTYYFENNNRLEKTIKRIQKYFPCTIVREYIEMNYSKLVIATHENNFADIEKILAPLV